MANSIVASGVLRSLFGRMFGALATGGLVGVIAWLLSHLLPIGVGAGVVGFLFAMLLGSSRGWTAGGGGWGGIGGGGVGERLEVEGGVHDARTWPFAPGIERPARVLAGIGVKAERPFGGFLP